HAAYAGVERGDRGVTITIAPRWALSGLALRDESTGWTSPGLHVRIMVSPALGFPLHPFIIYQLGSLTLDQGLGAGAWILEDDRGDPVRPANIQVQPGNGVWATLIDPDAACPFVVVDSFDDLRVDVIVDGPSGPNVVMSRSRAPYELGG